MDSVGFLYVFRGVWTISVTISASKGSPGFTLFLWPGRFLILAFFSATVSSKTDCVGLIRFRFVASTWCIASSCFSYFRKSSADGTVTGSEVVVVGLLRRIGEPGLRVLGFCVLTVASVTVSGVVLMVVCIGTSSTCNVTGAEVSGTWIGASVGVGSYDVVLGFRRL